MRAEANPPPIPKQSGSARPVLWVLLGFGVLLALPLALFYPVENWRGKRAWENCKRELEARGERLDWAAYMPPSVPDEQNVFKAPKMAEWFVGRNTNELAMRLHPDRLDTVCRRRHTNAVIELTVVSLDERIAPGTADLVLRFDSPILNPVSNYSSNSSNPRFEIIPLVQLADVPLRSAIQNLARQAGLKYVLDPKIDFRGSDGAEPLVTGRWEDVTAQQVLVRVLNQNNLQWVDDPKTGVARITVNAAGVPHVYVDPLARDQIRELIQRVIGRRTNDFSGPSMVGPQGFTFVVKPIGPVTPARVFVRSRTPPGLKSIVEFFPTNVPVSSSTTVALRVESAGDHFRVLLSPPPYTVAEYLTWSDQFKPDFDLIREALKRPYAQMDGDYRQPFAVPVPNFRSIRVVTQTAAQRAQCQMLLNQPEKAFQELTLVHDISGLLKEKAGSKPTTVLAVSIDMELVKLYTKTVGDGLTMHTWREPQLIAIQNQLQQVNLPPQLVNAFRAERAGLCHQLELTASAEHGNSLVKWFPRGWYYQNLATIVVVEQKEIEGFDLASNTLVKTNLDEFRREMLKCGAGFRPYTYLAAIGIPNFLNSFRTCAFAQTGVNEALVACALERYRIAHGVYPETLAALKPHFIEDFPHDVINGHSLKYRRTNDGFLLYSIGWNETDDGGMAAVKADGSVEESLGDWVWPSGK